MQHAHIGFRSVERSVAAIAEVHETCARRGVTVDRFGITLDWSMGYPATDRAGRGRGTVIVLNDRRILRGSPALRRPPPILATSCWACRARSTTPNMRLQPARPRSAISVNISRFGCPTGTTTSPPRRRPSPPSG
jgi:hypothetical protein